MGKRVIYVNFKFWVIVLILINFCIVVFADTQTTTLSWVIPANVVHTLSYGGNCSNSAMYFIETNSPEDPDIDGNGAKIIPYDAASSGISIDRPHFRLIITVN
ncbi:MAG: hypothetical protein QXK06_05355 [Candidatus Diapherotrites archaeon]